MGDSDATLGNDGGDESKPPPPVPPSSPPPPPEPPPEPPPTAEGSDEPESAEPASEQESGDSSDGGGGSAWPWVALAIGVVAVIAIALLAVLYMQALGDKDDAEDALAESEEALAETQREVDDLEAQLDDAQAEIDALTAQVEELEEAAMAVVRADLAVGVTWTDDEISCMAESMQEQLGLAAILVALAKATSVGTGQFDAEVAAMGVAVLEAADQCGIDLGEQTTFESGDSYGDNPELDELYDECEDGSGAACDDLYLQSEIGSEYEAFGGTCGERFSPAEAPIRCEDEI